MRGPPKRTAAATFPGDKDELEDEGNDPWDVFHNKKLGGGDGGGGGDRGG